MIQDLQYKHFSLLETGDCGSHSNSAERDTLAAEYYRLLLLLLLEPSNPGINRVPISE